MLSEKVLLGKLIDVGDFLCLNINKSPFANDKRIVHK